MYRLNCFLHYIFYIVTSKIRSDNLLPRPRHGEYMLFIFLSLLFILPNVGFTLLGTYNPIVRGSDVYGGATHFGPEH